MVRPKANKEQVAQAILDYLNRIEKLHKEIKEDHSNYYKACREDDQHPYWEPKIVEERE